MNQYELGNFFSNLLYTSSEQAQKLQKIIANCVDINEASEILLAAKFKDLYTTKEDFIIFVANPFQQKSQIFLHPSIINNLYNQTIGDFFKQFTNMNSL